MHSKIVENNFLKKSVKPNQNWEYKIRTKAECERFSALVEICGNRLKRNFTKITEALFRKIYFWSQIWQVSPRLVMIVREYVCIVIHDCIEK